jgi:hypothetical protein
VCSLFAITRLIFYLKAGVKASKCNYQIRSNCKFIELTHMDNDCAAPHSLFSEIESKQSAPFYPYWKPNLFGNIVRFFTGPENTIGDEFYQGDEIDGSVCISSNETMGLGEKFDMVGNGYRWHVKRKYRDWF